MRVRIAAALVAATAVLAAAALGAAPQPRLVSATAVGDRVNLTFSTALPQSPGGIVAVAVNGNAVRPTRTVVSGRRLQLVLPAPIFGDDVVTVSGRNLRARDRRRVRQFGLTALNRSTPGCTLDTEGPLDTVTALTTSRFRILSVTAEFADVSNGRPRIPPPEPLRLGGVDTWMRDLSYGRAVVEGTERPGTVRMPKNSTDYAFAGDWGARKSFFQDVVLSLDDEIDFSRYDALFVSYRLRSNPPGGIGGAAVAPTNTGVVADGKELRHFGAFTFANPASGLATLLQLTGLRRWSQEATGDWRAALDRVLNQRQRSLLGWDKRRLGWLDPTQVRCLRSQPLEVTLTPLALSGGAKLVVVPITPQAMLVLENRQRVGLDATQCKSGILAYEVRPDTAYRLRVFPSETRTTPDCRNFALAPYDLRPGGSASAA